MKTVRTIIGPLMEIVTLIVVGFVAVQLWGIGQGADAQTTFAAFIPAYTGRDSELVGLGSDPDAMHGLTMPTGQQTSAFARFAVPDYCLSDVVVKPIFEPALQSGNLAFQAAAVYGAVGEIFNNHTNISGAQIIGVTSDRLNAPYTLSLTNAAAGDIVSLSATRDGDRAEDTVGIVFFAGFWVECAQ